jgi:transposase
VHARRPFFVLADVEANARRRTQGRSASVLSPLALEAVRRIDALFDIERTINGQSVERRQEVRQDANAPLIADLARWLREERPTPSCRAATTSPKRWTTCEALARLHPLP